MQHKYLKANITIKTHKKNRYEFKKAENQRELVQKTKIELI